MSRKRERGGEQTNDAILQKLNLAIERESVDDVRFSLATILSLPDKEFYFSSIPKDSNPLSLAARCNNLEIIDLLVNSVFGDKTESLESACDIAYDHGNHAIRRFLDGVLEARYAEESSYDDEDEDTGEEPAAAPAPDSAVAEVARPSILTSNRVPYLDLARALAGATISHDDRDDSHEHDDADEGDGTSHSPDFGIPLERKPVSFDPNFMAVAPLAISACASAALAAPAAVAAPSSDERSHGEGPNLQSNGLDLTGLVTEGPDGVYYV